MKKIIKTKRDGITYLTDIPDGARVDTLECGAFTVTMPGELWPRLTIRVDEKTGDVVIESVDVGKG